ncbi:eukaryotic initiation factor 4F subunit, partial [Reticulomyxa filosa]
MGGCFSPASIKDDEVGKDILESEDKEVVNLSKEEEDLKKRESEEAARKRKEEWEEEERKRKEREEEERKRRGKWAEKRIHAMEELMKTEETYVESLTQCINIDLKTIRGINEAFLGELKKKWETFDNDSTKIGESIIQFIPYFRQYQNYLNNYGD